MNWNEKLLAKRREVIEYAFKSIISSFKVNDTEKQDKVRKLLEHSVSIYSDNSTILVTCNVDLSELKSVLGEQP